MENPVGQKFSILMKITNIVQKRKWTLPQLKFNQVQNLIDRLKVNKSPDYFGFSAKHIKLGAMVAVKYLKDYLNLSHTLNMEFQKVNFRDSVILFINLGENLYRNHRASEKITVCALLGQFKHMATISLYSSHTQACQVGLHPCLFVKLDNIMVTEKSSWAIAIVLILIIQFLNNTAAFDRTLHPVILSDMVNE